MAFTCPTTMSHGRSSRLRMPPLSCTVMVVMAVKALPPRAVMVLMSACMPAAPVLPEPVMLSTESIGFMKKKKK
ncbi:hypothetical protein, partial [Hallella colorans]|uniref:hypothetical protein n=1 Tax=Hallella colorans TaxID=1703337 RepID=UPI0023EFCB0F